MAKIFAFNPNINSESHKKVLKFSLLHKKETSKSDQPILDYARILRKNNWILSEKVPIDAFRFLFSEITEMYVEEVYISKGKVYVQNSSHHCLFTFDITHDLVESDLLRVGYPIKIEEDHPLYTVVDYFIDILNGIIKDIKSFKNYNNYIYLRGVVYILEEIHTDFRCMKGVLDENEP